jgi:hypothetical protein
MPDEVVRVVANRSGVVLSASTILKSDFFSNLQKMSLPEYVTLIFPLHFSRGSFYCLSNPEWNNPFYHPLDSLSLKYHMDLVGAQLNWLRCPLVAHMDT